EVYIPHVEPSNHSATGGCPVACATASTAAARFADQTTMKDGTSTERSNSWLASSTTWPRSAQSLAARRTAFSQSGCIPLPSSLRLEKAMRRRRGFSSIAASHEGGAGGAQ